MSMDQSPYHYQVAVAAEVAVAWILLICYLQSVPKELDFSESYFHLKPLKLQCWVEVKQQQLWGQVVAGKRQSIEQKVEELALQLGYAVESSRAASFDLNHSAFTAMIGVLGYTLIDKLK